LTITIRSDDPAGWTKVPHTLARDPRLTNGARGLAVQMLSHADGFKSDAQTLAQYTADGRDAIRGFLAELRTYGYLVRERVHGPGGKVTTRSVLYDVPQQTELPIDEPPTGRTSASRSGQGRFTKAGGSPHAAPRRDGVTSKNTENSQVTPSGGKPASRSDQARSAEQDGSPRAGNPPVGPTRGDTENPQVKPTGGKPATRRDQAEDGITAGGTDRRETRLQSEDQGEEQKKISQSARVGEVRAVLEGLGWPGLTDFIVSHLITEGMRRAATTGKPLQVPVERYLASWRREDLAEAMDQAYAAEDARNRAAEAPARDLDQAFCAVTQKGTGGGPQARTVAEAIADATPTPEPTPHAPQEPAQPPTAPPPGDATTPAAETAAAAIAATRAKLTALSARRQAQATAAARTGEPIPETA
jgi:hypothetical protein